RVAASLRHPAAGLCGPLGRRAGEARMVAVLARLELRARKQLHPGSQPTRADGAERGPVLPVCGGGHCPAAPVRGTAAGIVGSSVVAPDESGAVEPVTARSQSSSASSEQKRSQRDSFELALIALFFAPDIARGKGRGTHNIHGALVVATAPSPGCSL